MSHLATIGLGANLPSPAGLPQQTIRAALHDLSGAGKVVAASSLYHSEPVGNEDQPPFVNAIAQLTTDLEPEAFLAFLLATEQRYGRERHRDSSKGPRTLDLDLLLMDSFVIHSAALTLPHPALAARRFVLEPLCEIAPQLVHPVLRKTVAELLAELPQAGPNRCGAVRRIVPGQPADPAERQPI